MLDSTTVQFGWDAPQSSDEINIRGVLKGYQVIRLSSIVLSGLDRSMCACLD